MVGAERVAGEAARAQSYYEEQRAVGRSEESIRAALRVAGWTEDHIAHMAALAFMKEQRSKGAPASSAVEALRAAGWEDEGIDTLLATLMAEVRTLKLPQGALGCGEATGLREDDRRCREHQRHCIEEALKIRCDTVMVVGGEIPVSCEVCRRYDGTVLSLSGLAYPEVAQFAGGLTQAVAAGLFHRGCFHHPGAYPIAPRLDRGELNQRARAVAERLGVYVPRCPDETRPGP
ncbi:MAG: hypothetical protein FJX75_12495 [Armatimonadetes bacterium]|nr:hypothetical protein [Armatimonadota bacterium]